MKKTIFSFLVLLTLFSPKADFALAADAVELNFFYKETCPYCKLEKEFLSGLQEKYPDMVINQYEVISSRENQKLLADFYAEYDVPKTDQGWVPVIFTPNDYFLGFNDQVARDIESCVEECISNGASASSSSQVISVPLLGEIDVSKMSLPVLAVVFGALDGFNPCAMWVLLFLITLLINTRSKKRMYLIGGTFLLASGIIYYLILAAWFNLFLVISYVDITRMVIGVLALGVGLWQIRNFIEYEPNVCKVTDKEEGLQKKIKDNLKAGAEKLVSSPVNLGILAGIAALAFGVNIVEFFCSAGFPAIFTRVLALNNVSGFNYHLYLLIYTFMFMFDDLAVFLLAVSAINKFGFSEKYNYWSTLIGGLLIFVLGLLLLFKPELLMFT